MAAARARHNESPVHARVPPWIFAITAIAAFMVALDNLVVVTALPAIGASLDSGLEGLQWTVGAYTLTYAMFQLTGAALGDRFGRRLVFAIGLTLFTSASAVAAFSPSIHVLVGARTAQGLGAALVSPLALTLLAADTPRERRAAVLGIWSAVNGVAIAIGPLVGGAIVSGSRWQWIFLVNVPIGLVLIPAALLRLRESRGPRNRLDVPGALLACGGVFALVFAVISGNDLGWGGARLVVAVVACVVLLAAFVAWEARARTPMLPLGLFRERGFSAASAVYALMTFSLFGAVFLLTQFLQQELRYSALAAGVAMLPAAAMPAVAAAFTGAVDRRIGGRATVAVALGTQAVALAWLAVVAQAGAAYVALLPGLMLLGIAAGLFFGQISRLILASVPVEYEGMASGTGTTFRQIGTTLGVATLGAVFAAAGGFGPGLRIALVVAAGAAAVAVAVAAAIPPVPERDRAVARTRGAAS